MTLPPDYPDGPLPEVSRLPREVAPPPELEGRVVAEMRQQKLLRRPNWQPWLQVAAAILLLVSGIGIGWSMAPSPIASPPRVQPRFMLLLWGAAPVADDNARAREYGAWASAERKLGREISGERLADEALLIERDRSSPVPSEVQGFFIVSAASLEEAAAVARSSPHVRDGGRIVVRPIDTP